MLVGYIGLGLAAKASAPRIGLGSLVAAAFLLDILLWLFVILHLESAAVPADFESHHALAFGFPWSHSLLAAVFWSLAAGFVWTWSGGEGKYLAFAPAVVSATVFSHWGLDFIVHPPELTLWGPGSPAVGLDLGQPAALYLEVVLGALGLGLYLWRRRPAAVPRATVTGMVLFAAMLSAANAFAASPPASILTHAAAALLTMTAAVIVSALADRDAR
jgi:hypothetical protein